MLLDFASAFDHLHAMAGPVLSLVLPVLNEEAVLPALFDRLQSTLQTIADTSYEVIFVNDGSTDRTRDLLGDFCARHAQVVVLNLSRNFGHQASITAGLHAARGRCVVIMDADLQDPPELIPQLLQRWREGYHIVVAARRSRAETGFRRVLFSAFYRALDLLSDFPMGPSSGVFGLIDRRVVGELLGMRERNRFLPGMRSWLGFRQTSVPYDRADRSGGPPKQTLMRLFRYGFDAIFSFSYKPLRVSWVLGTVISSLCFFYALILVVMRVLEINVVRGFTTPTVAILFLGGIQLIAIGVLGEYLGRIYDEVKGRPLYVVEEELRHPDAPPSSGAGSDRCFTPES